MIFRYTAVSSIGEKKEGVIEAASRELAVSGLSRRGLIVTSLKTEAEAKKWYEISIGGDKVPLKDVVVLSRQMSTLFEAQVSALKAFSLLADNSDNKALKKRLQQIVTDLQGGLSIANSLAKHTQVFSPFYVNMVRAGEESGKLTQVFLYLADYLDRQYALNSKVKNALIYPSFVIGVFVIVMTLMFTVIVPKLSVIIKESGQDIPIYTKAVMWLSDFLINYGIFLLIFVVVIGAYLFQLSRTKRGKEAIDVFKLKVPIFGALFRKLYLARIADNMDTMLTSGIQIVRAIEITSEVVGNKRYSEILIQSMNDVKAGKPFSDSMAGYEEIPNIMPQIIKVGEETGSLGQILKMLAKFYKREMEEAVDALVGLIEPFMIIMLGLGVGLLLVSVMMPIYNIAGGIQ
jgi:type IV pilus assembly protein PilC